MKVMLDIYHSAYTFQGWASEVKGRWDAQKSVGAKTRLSRIKLHEVKLKPDSSENLLGRLTVCLQASRFQPPPR